MDYEEMICRFYVPGSNNSEERMKAEEIGMKAYKQCNKWVIRPIVTPLYNKIWSILFPKYTKEEYIDEDKMYTKMYFRICNFIGKIGVFLCGGYWFSEKRKVCLNYNYWIKPIENKDPNEKATHYVDEMISIKRFGE